VFGVRSLPGPPGGSYSVSSNPVPELRREGRENDKGSGKKKRKGEKSRKERGNSVQPFSISGCLVVLEKRIPSQVSSHQGYWLWLPKPATIM